jgi:hypothetical protein
MRKNPETIAQHLVLCFARCALLFVLSASAQAQEPKKIPRIGYLSGATAEAQSTRTDAFRQGLRVLGYVEEKNINIEYRYAEGKLDRYPRLPPNW